MCRDTLGTTNLLTSASWEMVNLSRRLTKEFAMFVHIRVVVTVEVVLCCLGQGASQDFLPIGGSHAQQIMILMAMSFLIVEWKRWWHIVVTCLPEKRGAPLHFSLRLGRARALGLFAMNEAPKFALGVFFRGIPR